MPGVIPLQGSVVALTTTQDEPVSSHLGLGVGPSLAGAWDNGMSPGIHAGKRTNDNQLTQFGIALCSTATTTTTTSQSGLAGRRGQRPPGAFSTARHLAIPDPTTTRLTDRLLHGKLVLMPCDHQA